MAKAVIDSLEDVAEALRGEYREGTSDEGLEGKFVLVVEPAGGYGLENVDGLKSALGKERTEREKLEKIVVKYKDLDPDKARQALAKLEELEKIDPSKEADKIANSKFEAAKSQLLEKHSGELSERDERITKLTKTIEELLVDNAATAAIAEAKGSVELLLPHVRRSARVKEVDGKFVVEVVGPDGNVRIGDSKGTPLDIKGLVAEMKASEVYGRAFEASGNSGTGKVAGNSGTGGAGQLKRSQMSAEQKREYQQAHGQEAFLKLPQ